jgi:hypothetical protein
VNRAHVSALFGQLALVCGKIAAEFAEEPGGAPPSEPLVSPAERRRITDIDKARARRALRKKGIPV